MKRFDESLLEASSDSFNGSSHEGKSCFGRTYSQIEFSMTELGPPLTEFTMMPLRPAPLLLTT